MCCAYREQQQTPKFVQLIGDEHWQRIQTRVGIHKIFAELWQRLRSLGMRPDEMCTIATWSFLARATDQEI
jgi:hypothetical protein